MWFCSGSLKWNARHFSHNTFPIFILLILFILFILSSLLFSCLPLSLSPSPLSRMRVFVLLNRVLALLWSGLFRGIRRWAVFVGVHCLDDHRQGDTEQ